MWDDQLYFRRYNGGWQSWRTALDNSNYTSYSPSLTGSGASGTWGINITGNSATVGGKYAREMSWGHDYSHGNFTDFNYFNSTDYFGAHFIQSTTNGPGHSGAGQYYHMRLSLGSNYNNYSLQLAIPRNVSDAYLYYRYEEGGGYGSWYKMRAGYADSAGSAGSASSITTAATNTGDSSYHYYYYVSTDASGAATASAFSGGLTLTVQRYSPFTQVVTAANFEATRFIATGGTDQSNYGYFLRPDDVSYLYSSYLGFTKGNASNKNSGYYSDLSPGYIQLNKYNTGSGSIFVDFTRSTPTLSYIGSITQNGTTGVAYNTTSDYRLKDNIQNLSNSGAFIDALTPRTWTWKSDNTSGVGFIAHEVQVVSPSTVHGEKDEMVDVGILYDTEGEIENENVRQPPELRDGQTWIKTGEVPKYQVMEYGSAEFIANIIAELQSLRKRVAELEQKL
jgi:hypothetical protein